MDTQEPRGGPPCLEFGQGDPHEVARTVVLGVQARVVTLRLHPANVAASDEPHGRTDRHRQHLVLPARGGVLLDHPVHRAAQPLPPDRLEEVVGRTQLERLDRAGLVGGDEDDRRWLREGEERAGELGAAEARHVDVEECDPHRTGGELPQGVGAVARREDLADARVGTQQVHELIEGRLLVIGDEDVDHAAPQSSSGSWRGCDFGTRMRTRVPAPALVSTTSPPPLP